MFLKKKTITILIIIFIVIIGGFLALNKKRSQPVYSTTKAERMTLKQTVDATGNVESAEAINLNFKNSGRLQKIYVKIGEEVKAGQKLAQLEAGDLESQIASARASLEQAQADYDKTLAGSSAEEIAIQEETVRQKSLALTAAEDNLADLKNSQSTEVDNYRDALITTLTNEVLVAENALLVAEDTLDYPDAEDTLSLQNPPALITANNNLSLTKDAVTIDKSAINAISFATTAPALTQISDNLKNSLDKISLTLSSISDVLGATLTSNDLSQTELDTLKSDIKTQQTKINTSLSNVQTAKANWTYKIAYYQNQITSAENSVRQAEATLAIAKNELLLKKSPPRSFEIEAARAKVSQAQANLNLAYARLNEALITAPVNGTITKKNFEVGEQTSLTTPVLEMIGKTNLQIEVNIPESDIAKIKLGQTVTITLDAFGTEREFAGTVIFVDPAATIIQDVVYYQIKIQFDQPETEIKPGMTANVTICTNRQENVLVVPARAVKTTDGEKYVEILTLDKKVEKIIVQTGMRGDEGIEIVSGLEGGEEVITFVKK